MKHKTDLAYYLSFIILGLFPVAPFAIKPYLLAPLCLTSIYCLSNAKTSYVEWKKVVISSFLFGLFALGFFQSSDTDKAVELLLRLSPFLLLPIAFSAVPSADFLRFKSIFINTFISSCFVFCLLVIGYSLSLDSSDLPYIFSYLRDKFWGYEEHPIYISLYLGVSSILLIQSTLKTSLKYFIFIVFLFTLLFLSRKGNIISLVLVLLFTLIYNSNLFLNRTSLRLALITFSMVTLCVLLFNNFILERFSELLDVGDFIYNTASSSGIRSIVWRSSVRLILEAPITGYGLGDVQQSINAQLINDGYEQLTQRINYDAPAYYNAHNQYLQLTLSSGFFGIAGFLIVLTYMLITLKRNKDIVGLNVFIYIILCFMFESLLERQNGIIMSAIFFNLFFFMRTPTTKQQE